MDYYNDHQNNEYDNYNYQDNSSKDNVIRINGKAGIIFLIWFIVSFVGIILFSKKFPGISLIMFGQLFFGVGCFVISKTKNKLENFFLFIFPIVGFIIILVGIFMLINSPSLNKMITPLIPYIALGVFFLIGVGVCVFPFISDNIKRKRCTVELEAIVVDLKTRLGTSKRLYSPVYEFYFMHITQRVCNEFYSNVGLPNIGDRQILFVNPNNPNDFIIKKDSNKVFTVVIGSIMMLGAIAISIFMLTK